MCEADEGGVVLDRAQVRETVRPPLLMEGTQDTPYRRHAFPRQVPR